MFALYRVVLRFERGRGAAGDKRRRRVAEEQSGMKTPLRVTAAKFDEARAAEVAKTARLRALRLAKEAADRDAAQSAAATRTRVEQSPRARGSIRPGRRKETG